MASPNLAAARQKAANVLRSYAANHVPVDVAKLAADAGVSVVYESFEDQSAGVLVRDADRVVIGVNSNHPAPSQRFTIAHELGHYFLHAEAPTVFIDDAEGLPGVDQSFEVEANAFAAALLIPESAVVADVPGGSVGFLDHATIESLATRYQVSAHALTVRLLELGLLKGLV